jgi:hypothetical protein
LCAQLGRKAVETLAAATAALSKPGMWIYIGIANDNYQGPLDPRAGRTAVLRGAKGRRVTVQVRALASPGADERALAAGGQEGAALAAHETDCLCSTSCSSLSRAVTLNH